MDRFDIVLKKKVHAQYSGLRESRMLGHGMIFKDYKDYVPGDDFRAVDWRVFARTDNLFVRQYEEERNLTTHVIIDASASMNFGQNTKKYEYAAMVALGFAYMALRNNERFEVSTFSDALNILKPAKGASMLLSILDQLNNTTPKGKSILHENLLHYKAAIKSKSLIVIISDFLFNLEELRRALYLFREERGIRRAGPR